MYNVNLFRCLGATLTSLIFALFCNSQEIAIDPQITLQPISTPLNVQIPDNAAEAQGQDETLTINLADRADLDLPAFVRWLAQVRGMRILDDGRLNVTNKVKFYGKSEVSSETMFELVQGVLRSNKLALVRADVEGWYRIVPLADVRPFAPRGQPEDFDRADYITGVFVLQHIDPTEADLLLKKLVYGDNNPAGNSVQLINSRNTIIVTDTAKKLAEISRLIAEIDLPQEEILTEIYNVKYLEVGQLEQQLRQLLNLSAGGAATEGGADNTTRSTEAVASSRSLRIVADVRTNRLILFGSAREIRNAQKSIALIDVKLDIEFRRYQFDHVSASRIDTLVKQSLGVNDAALVDRIYQSSINEAANELLVTAREEIHQRIENLETELDKPSRVSQINNPVQFYTLENVQAVDILDTLQSIVRRVRGNRDPRRLNGINARPGFGVNGPNNFPGALGGVGTPPTSLQNSVADSLLRDALQSTGQGNFPGNTRQGTGQSVVDGLSGLVNELEQSGLGGPQNIVPGEAQITVDENSNTLIIAAEPAVQQLYADLIERLDRRRPQVLIEVTFVTLSANEDFQLGVEISGGDREGDNRLFSFSSFGLSTVDALTGSLALMPGTGFNGTLVDPDVADVVVRALSANDRSRVVAAPKILVNDNATGVLSSVAEVPFTSINAANTVSSTSFAGFAEAGTTISVTPQISEDDYLNLEFDILINTFTGTVDADSGVPPPRSSNQVTSQVAIPDGHTVIVGGLTSRSISESFAGIPLLERIPIIRRLSSNEIKDFDESRVFVFIKPTILRDDKFRDLRFISELRREEASVAHDFPHSEPVLIK